MSAQRAIMAASFHFSISSSDAFVSLFFECFFRAEAFCGARPIRALLSAVCSYFRAPRRNEKYSAGRFKMSRMKNVGDDGAVRSRGKFELVPAIKKVRYLF